MLTALSVQLALYAIAWLLIGSAFGLARKAVFSWSSSWAILAVITYELAEQVTSTFSWAQGLVNFGIVLSFALLIYGTGESTKIPVGWKQLALPIICVLLVDILRYFWLEETSVLRWVLFTVCVILQICQVAIRQAASLKNIGFSRLAALVWAPAFIVICFFLLRVAIFLFNRDGISINFTGVSLLDKAYIALFFVALGSFNFAQASFVIGLMANRMRELSHTDQLTQLANRRSLMQQLGREDARFFRTGRGFTLAIFDIDHFKSVNDRYGHLGGDKVLKAVSSTMIREIRSSDMLSRYGGEEFLLLMPETDLQEALVMAERIREKISSQPIQVGDSEIFITISGGIAETLKDHRDFEGVIKRADDALYVAKECGRNQIKIDIFIS